jgi:general secretion pathway protein N
VTFPIKKALLLAVPVFLFGILARVPATVVMNWALPEQVASRGISGTIWNGRVAALEVESVGVGPLEWQLSPFALLTGKARAQIEAQLPGGFLNGDIALSLAGKVTARELRAQFDLEPFTKNSSIGPTLGVARISADRLILESQWPSSVTAGTLELHDLVYPGVGTQPLGSHRISFSDNESDPAYPVRGVMDTIDGAFDVDGNFDLGPQMSYRMVGTLATSDSAPAGLADQLRFLGQPDRTGRFPFNWEGSLTPPSAP